MKRSLTLLTGVALLLTAAGGEPAGGLEGLEEEAAPLSAEAQSALADLFQAAEFAPADLREALEGLVAALSARASLSARRRRVLESVTLAETGDGAVRVRFPFAVDFLP